MCRFELEGDPAGPTLVEEGSAYVAVDVAATARPSQLSDGTRAYLHARLVDPDDDSLVLAEAVVRSGADVVVRATSASTVAGGEASAGGFRVAAKTRVLSGSAASPLVIEPQARAS
jgi:hypothetical protein